MSLFWLTSAFAGVSAVLFATCYQIVPKRVNKMSLITIRIIMFVQKVYLENGAIFALAKFQ